MKMKVYMIKHTLEEALVRIKNANLGDQDEVELVLNDEPISDVGITITGQSIEIITYKED